MKDKILKRLVQLIPSENQVRKRKKKNSGSGGIRTHAIEMTGALNQRLRPLGHATNLNEALNGLFFLHLQVLMTVALHLLMNLSFDPSLREEMITLGYLPKLVAQLGQYVNVHINEHIVQDEILARSFIIIGRFGYLKIKNYATPS